jgi:tRNA (guanine-N7-)-methyltransferase
VRRPARLPLEDLQPVLLEAPDPPAPLAWRTLFGNDHPVEIEVGFGKGLFLVGETQARSEVNFLGIEIERKLQLYTATRLVKRGVRNVKLVKADGRLFLRDCVAAGSVQAVHVYFPDPWWKKRHHKRRLFTAEFAEQCERVLRPGGELHIATDVEEYFGIITEMIAQSTKLRVLPPPTEKEPTHDLDYLTNFERKARKLGMAVYRAIYERGTS